ncbi:MAG: bacteriohopanetetrol glucosamine biosynthesis glycosyltransferase HpnI [candidate division WOR-3 bacterium]
MLTTTATLKLLLFGLTLAAIAYYLVCICAAIKFFSESPPKQGSEFPPVTILIPLCGADFEAYENYASFCRQDYPEFQIVFGVRDEQDPSLPIIRKLIADFPDREIELVLSAERIGANLKVSNLHNMLGKVKHEYLVIADSDIRVKEDYLRSLVPVLSNEQVGLVTCLYRAAPARSWASRLQGLTLSATFQPSVLVARLLEGMRFALGATMATTRTKLQSVGGLEALADSLLDDYMLGHLLWRAGYEVRLSHTVIETVLAPVSFLSLMRHQIRWARGTRFVRPLGYVGLIMTHGTVLSLLNLAAHQGSPLSMLLLGLTLAARLTVGWIVGMRGLHDESLKKYVWLLPVSDLLDFLVWCVASVGRKVEWRGTVYEILKGGKIVQVPH